MDEVATVLARYVLSRSELLTGLFHLSSEPISKFQLLDLVRCTWSLDHIRVSPDDSVVVDRSLDSSLLRKEIKYVPAPWGQLVAGMHSFYGALDAES